MTAKTPLPMHRERREKRSMVLGGDKEGENKEARTERKRKTEKKK